MPDSAQLPVPAAQAPDEPTRLAALRELDVLDTAAEQIFDDIAKMASLVCGTPIALISLVDADRQWFKARIGLEVSETSRDLAFCAHAILAPASVMAVEDATLDPRFATNPLVTGDPGIRFYAGAPIVVGNGQSVGTVCAIDRQAKRLTADQTQMLQLLARQAGRLLDLRKGQLDSQRALQDEVDRGRARLAQTVALSAQALDLQAYIDCNYVYRFVNDRHLTYWKARREDVEGKSVADLIGADLFERRVKSNMDQALAGHSVELEVKIDYPGAGTRHMQVTYLPLREQGRVVGLVMRSHDVNDLRQAQERLAHAHESLVARNAVQQQFIHMVSHDLREPVNSICNFSDELISNHVQELSPAARRYLGFVHSGGIRMKSLLDDLIQYVRLDGKPIRHEPVDLDSVFADVRSDLANAVSASGATVECEPLGWVLGDATMLRVLFQNLVDNGIKFCAEGRAPHVRVRAVDEGAVRTVSVADEGIGIRADQIDRLFGVFQRLESRRRFDGTGLGLATCKRIADMHGGRIDVRSELGVGSEFRVSLPATHMGAGD